MVQNVANIDIKLMVVIIKYIKTTYKNSINLLLTFFFLNYDCYEYIGHKITLIKLYHLIIANF